MGVFPFSRRSLGGRGERAGAKPRVGKDNRNAAVGRVQHPERSPTIPHASLISPTAEQGTPNARPEDERPTVPRWTSIARRRRKGNPTPPPSLNLVLVLPSARMATKRPQHLGEKPIALPGGRAGERGKSAGVTIRGSTRSAAVPEVRPGPGDHRGGGSPSSLLARAGGVAKRRRRKYGKVVSDWRGPRNGRVMCEGDGADAMAIPALSATSSPALKRFMARSSICAARRRAWSLPVMAGTPGGMDGMEEERRGKVEVYRRYC